MEGGGWGPEGRERGRRGDHLVEEVVGSLDVAASVLHAPALALSAELPEHSVQATLRLRLLGSMRAFSLLATTSWITPCTASCASFHCRFWSCTERCACARAR